MFRFYPLIHKGAGQYIIPWLVLDWSDRNMTSVLEALFKIANCCLLFSAGFSFACSGLRVCLSVTPSYSLRTPFDLQLDL